MRILNGSYSSGVTLTAGDSPVLVGGTVIHRGDASYAAIYAPSGVNAEIRNLGIIGDDQTAMGVRLKSAGTITNGAANVRDALITGYNYAILADSDLKLANYGTISGENGAVKSFGAGVVRNGAQSDQSALISAAEFNALLILGAGTVINMGTIQAQKGEAVYLVGGGSVVNGASTATQSKIVGYLVGVGVGVSAHSATVTNFGSIQATGHFGAGVYATASTPTLRITNGSATSTAATIAGNYGIQSKGASATITNFGAIEGVRTGTLNKIGDGVLMNSGLITNGSATSTAALITGHFAGVLATGATTINNFAQITGGIGAILEGGGVITNGSAADHAAHIGGGLDGIDVSGAAAVTVTNYGTIDGAIAAIDFGTGNDQLNVGAGSVLKGVVDGGGGGDTVTFVSGGTHAVGNFRNFEVFNLFASAANRLTLTTANLAGAKNSFVQVNGGDAGDTVNAGAAASALVFLDFVGGTGADTVAGGAAADILNGGGGLDTLIGGGGADLLSGGANTDTFKYLRATDSTSASSDRINDFTAGSGADHDLIDLSAFAGVTALQGLITPSSPSETPPSNGVHAHSVVWYQVGSDTVVLVDATSAGDHVSLEILLSNVTASSLSKTAGVNFLLHPPTPAKPALLAQTAAGLGSGPGAETAAGPTSGRAAEAQLLNLASRP